MARERFQLTSHWGELAACLPDSLQNGSAESGVCIRRWSACVLLRFRS